ncbi:unnamed protein product [Musa acuminata var. zebrina]
MVLIDGFQGRVLSTKAVNVSDFYDFMVLLPFQRYHKPDISFDVEKRKHFMKLHIHLAMFLLLKYSSRSFEVGVGCLAVDGGLFFRYSSVTKKKGGYMFNV